MAFRYSRSGGSTDTAEPRAGVRASRRLWARWLILALASLLIAACGGADDGRVDAPPPAPPPAEGEPRDRPAPDGELRVSFLDVGQGDATLLQAPNATLLIDAGRHDRDDVVPALRAREVEEIDVVAITHGHADHIGQLPQVLSAFPTAEVWMSGTTHTTLTFERAIAAVEESDAAYEEPRAGDRTRVGSLRVEVVHPAELTGDLHAASLSMRVGFGQVSFLLTGDAEAPHEAEMVTRDGELLAAEVYQAGHHGSRTSTSTAFLAAVDPDVAVYSAGEGNQYGHPHEEVIDRLRAAGVEIYGTDVHGTVTVTTDGVAYEVSTEGEGSPVRGGAGQPRDPPAPEPESRPGGMRGHQQRRLRGPAADHPHRARARRADHRPAAVRLGRRPRPRERDRGVAARRHQIPGPGLCLRRPP